jgi:multidrug resistance protein, MATE family
VLVGQLAVMAFGITDTVVAGRYADTALAALSVGSAIYISVFVALMGVLQSLLPVWAELHGAQRQAEVGRSFRQALYLCALSMVVGVVILLAPGALLRWTGVPEALRDEVTRYLAVLSLALPPALLFRMFSTLNQSLGKPLLVTWLQAGSLWLKIPLSVGLAFGGSVGGLSWSPMGLVGCAWATVWVNLCMLAVALWLLKTQDLYRPYRIWQAPEAPDMRQLRAFVRLGVPGGLAILVEVTSFTLMALFIARLGTVASASHQIAASVSATLYMVPLSIGIATSARVSYWLGANRPTRARAAIRAGMLLAIGAATLMAGSAGWLRASLAGIYATNPAVVALAASLLGWVTLYHAADAVQAVCMFVLRCYRVTLVPLVVYCVLLWGLGLAGGYLLAYGPDGVPGASAGPADFWVTSSVALTLTASAFVFILWRVARPERPRQAPTQAPVAAHVQQEKRW